MAISGSQGIRGACREERQARLPCQSQGNFVCVVLCVSGYVCIHLAYSAGVAGVAVDRLIETKGVSDLFEVVSS